MKSIVRFGVLLASMLVFLAAGLAMVGALHPALHPQLRPDREMLEDYYQHYHPGGSGDPRLQIHKA